MFRFVCLFDKLTLDSFAKSKVGFARKGGVRLCLWSVGTLLGIGKCLFWRTGARALTGRATFVYSLHCHWPSKHNWGCSRSCPLIAHSHAPSLLASVASWGETLRGTQWIRTLLLECLYGHRVGTWSCFPSPSMTTVPLLVALKTLPLMLFSSSVLPLKCPSPPTAMLSALFRYSQPVLWYHEGPIDLGVSSLWSHLSRYTLSQISLPNIGQSPPIHSLVLF